MAPITKARHLTCPLGPINPNKRLQPEITAFLVTLKVNNKPLNPLRRWDFRLKMTLSNDRFGPIEHLAWTSPPKLDIGYVLQAPVIPTNGYNQKLQPLE